VVVGGEVASLRTGRASHDASRADPDTQAAPPLSPGPTDTRVRLVPLLHDPVSHAVCAPLSAACRNPSPRCTMLEQGGRAQCTAAAPVHLGGVT
jgi:hypothetical protein